MAIVAGVAAVDDRIDGLLSLSFNHAVDNGYKVLIGIKCNERIVEAYGRVDHVFFIGQIFIFIVGFFGVA